LAVTEVDAGPVVGVRGITAGEAHTCALLADGTAECWGSNHYGQLGDGKATGPWGPRPSRSARPVTVTHLSGATDIEAGCNHTCALLSNGTVACWGYNLWGQLGDGTTIDSSTPRTVSNSDSVTAIAAGCNHTCALLSSGSVECWGNKNTFDLSGGPRGSSTPELVPDLTGATDVAAGENDTCALLVDGTVACWGENEHGQLGNGTTNPSSTPRLVRDMSRATDISASGTYACSLVSGATVQCWGSLAIDTLAGDASTSPPPVTSPVAMPDLSEITDVVAGVVHACVLHVGGTVECWGANDSGQLGDSRFTRSTTPLVVPNLTDATAIAVGYAHTCALRSSGAVECWGDNKSGQLGNGTFARSATPTRVSRQ
jgi:alpha-tubulin suppressor-like RCC1 family protein